MFKLLKRIAFIVTLMVAFAAIYSCGSSGSGDSSNNNNTTNDTNITPEKPIQYVEKVHSIIVKISGINNRTINGSYLYRCADVTLNATLGNESNFDKAIIDFKQFMNDTYKKAVELVFTLSSPSYNGEIIDEADTSCNDTYEKKNGNSKLKRINIRPVPINSSTISVKYPEILNISINESAYNQVDDNDQPSDIGMHVSDFRSTIESFYYNMLLESGTNDPHTEDFAGFQEWYFGS